MGCSLSLDLLLRTLLTSISRIIAWSDSADRNGGTRHAPSDSVRVRASHDCRRIDPGDPLDKNLYELPPEELANVPSVPDSLSGAIKALSDDHGFLLKGDVFNADFVANWIEMKQKEYDALRLRPHPYEFAMYYDV